MIIRIKGIRESIEYTEETEKIMHEIEMMPKLRRRKEMNKIIPEKQMRLIAEMGFINQENPYSLGPSEIYLNLSDLPPGASIGDEFEVIFKPLSKSI